MFNNNFYKTFQFFALLKLSNNKMSEEKTEIGQKISNIYYFTDKACTKVLQVFPQK